MQCSEVLSLEFGIPCQLPARYTCAQCGRAVCLSHVHIREIASTIVPTIHYCPECDKQIPHMEQH